MKFQHVSGLEADRQRRIRKDLVHAKRHKDMQELHEYKEKMRQGAEDASKINELRRIEGYLSRVQPHARLSYIHNRPDMVAKRAELVKSVGLSSTPM